MEAASARTPRKSAAERREEIVRAAIDHFAVGGYHGTSTEAIARDAGISQPYLFRLFRTKRELFLACEARVHDRILEAFTAAAEGLSREERLAAMGKAYTDLLGDRRLLLFQMQTYAASSDEVIRDEVRDSFGALVQAVRELTGAEGEELFRFFGAGMLLNVIATLDLTAIAATQDWAAALCGQKAPPA
jgi:AcrR family transcriptional regulator